MTVALPPVPTIGAPPAWSPPAPELLTSAGGWPIYVRRDPTLPLVSLRIQVAIGAADDPIDRWGLASLAAGMLGESAGDLDALERAAALDRLAAKHAVVAGRDWTTVALEVHRDRFAAALPHVADTLLRPRLDEDDWDRVQRRHVTSVRQALDDNNLVAAGVTARLILGEAHPYGHNTQGTVATTTAATLDDVRRYLDGFHSGDAAIVVVGAVDDAALAALDDALKGWTGLPRPDRDWPELRARPGRWFVDSPGSAQTVIRACGPGPAGPDPTLAAAELARIVLGGSFTSRLNRRLREEKGYTYGARVSLQQFAHAGIALASASVQADATADATVDLLAVLALARDKGFEDVEVERAKAQALTDLVETAESRAALAGTYMQEIEAGRDPLGVADGARQLLATTSEQMHAAARQWLDPDRMGLILVGDAASAIPALEARGLGGWALVDPTGAPL
jgi:zinc protease